VSWMRASADPVGDALVLTYGNGVVVKSSNIKTDGVAACRLNLDLKKVQGHIASWGILIPLKLSHDPHHIETTAPGRFRLERCRLDQNDERIASWLSSEERLGKDLPLWPK